jgi:deoxycytidylate deaminase
MSYVPEHMRGNKTVPRKLLAILLAPDKATAEKAAKARWGPLATAQSVAAMEAEQDDLSAVKRSRKPPEVSPSAIYVPRAHPCLICKQPIVNDCARVCVPCRSPEKMAARRLASARVRYAQRAKERLAIRCHPCAWGGCTVLVKTEGGYCGSHAAQRNRENGGTGLCHWPGCGMKAVLTAGHRRLDYCSSHMETAKRATG